MELKKLFEPIKIGKLNVRNRIVAAPTLPCLAMPDGHASRELIEYYKAKAKGGAGIVTVGESAVDREYAVTHAGQLILDSDKFIPSLSELAEAIKRYGAKASLELCHGGRQTLPELIDGRRPIAPSPMSSRFHEILAGHKIPVQEMDAKAIEEVIDHFANAAFRLQRAGFDMALVHGGHGWLLAQFLSPYTNKRTDAYGGSLENRARFPIEVIEAIRKKVGSGFAIEYRMSGNELVPGGLTIEEAVKFAKMIEDKVDCIHVSAGMMAEPATIPYFHPPTYLPHAPNVPLAARIKKAVNVPVTCVGAIVDPEMAENILQQGQADLVAMARGLIADPAFPQKARASKSYEIIPCTRCNECLGRVATFLPLRCAVNPVTGRETEFNSIQAAQKRKKVLVVGGGAAGLEAACVAASRGHHVTLFEKTEKLGGNLAIAAIPGFKGDMRRFLDYLLSRVKYLTIDVKLATEASAANVKAVSPEVMILAVGAEPLIPNIPGVSRPNVVWAGDVLSGKSDLGQRIVVAGGGLVGCETALFLAQQGKRAVVVEMTDQVATDLNPVSRILLLELLDKQGVVIRKEVKLEGILENGVVVIDKDWNREKIDTDSVVLSLGLVPRTKVVENLEGLVPEVYAIGDCVSPRKLMDSVHDAFNVAVEI